MDDKVGHWFAFAVELWSDAGVVGMKAGRVEARVVAFYEIQKLVELGRIEGVVDFGNPFDVGTELAAAAEVYGGVKPEPGSLRQGIDMALKG